MPKRSSSLERARKQEVTLEILPHNAFQSFRCFMHDYPAPGARYCVHIEYEIHLIRKGSGHYKIGDKIGKFKAGQVSILGSRVPHDWVSDLRKDQIIHDRDVVIQFSREWLEKVRKIIPEITDFEPLLDQAQRAIIFQGASSKAAEEILETISQYSGIEQVMKLMEVLLLMSRAPESDREYILENPYQSNSGPLARLAAEKGVTYIFNNIDKKIRLQDAAKLSFMSESHFSRVFKEASGLTFSNMIRKLRIEHGCNLLVSTELPIAIISKDCGFTNLSNFNRQFLREMGVSPRAFRALQIRQRVALLEQVFGHKNQLLQQAKINIYIDKNSSQVSEYMTKVPTNKHVSEPKN
jgi:AraC-like DNA-binding protein